MNVDLSPRSRSYFAPRMKLPPVPVAVSSFLRMSIPLLAVLLATAFKTWLDPMFGDRAPFLLFFGAVAISSWFGGLFAGIVATLLSASLSSGVLPWLTSANMGVNGFAATGMLLQTALFATESLAVSFLIHVLKTAQAQSAQRASELQNSEDRYRRVLDTAFEGVWIVDSQGRTSYVNQHMAAMIGTTPEEMQGVSVFDLIPGDDRAAVQQRLQERSQGARAHFEARLLHKNGTTVWILVSSTPLQDERGQFQGSFSMITDISERKRIEEVLGQSEERYRAFVTQSSEAIWRFELEQPIDPNMTIDQQIEHAYRHCYLAECNDAMAHLYGFENAGQITGARMPELLPRNETNRAYLHDFFSSGCRLADAESEERDKDGNVKYFLNNLIGLYENGMLRRVWGMQRDITAQKQVEQQRATMLEREHDARIAAQMAHVAAEIARREAEHAQQEALNASRAKDEFLATLSHELRTPLNSIIGWSQMLNEENLDSQMTSYALAAISRNAKLQAQLVEDLLDISRITMGRMQIEDKPLAVCEVVGAAMETVYPAAKAKDVVIEYSNECDDCLVGGDAHRLQQVVWNLLSNAIKFTPEGGRVCVVQERRDDWVRLSISDNGQGIAPAFLPHVFEAFRQADSSSTRSHGGVGLGLSIVKKIVDLHNGTIQAHSPGEGQGATFVVELPVVDNA